MSITLPDGWESWNNSPIVLFHGTLASAAESVADRVDLSFGNSETDFGRGFYTTTLFSQAVEWAETKAVNSPGDENPAVVRVELNRHALSQLHHIAFVRGAKDAEDFWRFVFHCREGLPHMLESESNYDVVYGPVAAVWEDPPRREVFPNFDQISFHTSDAAAMLNTSSLCVKGVIRDWR
jgi:hypothetical protein